MNKKTSGRMIPMNLRFLQLFAEGGDAPLDAEVSTGENSGAAEPANEPVEQEKKYTDADVNAIIDKKFAKWKKEQEDEANEAKKLAKMNESEKAEYEKNQLMEEIRQLKEEKTLNDLTVTARGMLSEADVHVSDSLVARLVSLDAEATKEAVTAFIKDFQSAVAEEVKKSVRQAEPGFGSSSAQSAQNYGAKLAQGSVANGGPIF